MTRLLQLLLLTWTFSPLCLSTTVSFIGSPEECKTAHFVPGYNLGGEGFDIVKMQRKSAYVIDTETWDLGNGTCRMYGNSYQNGEKQKIPVSVVDWRNVPKCNLRVSSMVYDSVESLVNSSTSSVSNNWKIGLEVPFVSVGFGGSHSKVAEFGIAKSKQDRYTFTRHSVSCTFYNYRLTTNPPLHHEFKTAVKSLPPNSSGLPYRNFIDTYGTHYITQVFLGGEIKATTSIRTCEASLKGLSATEVSDCLSVEASVNFAFVASIKAMYENCQKKKQNLGYGQSFNSVFSERITEVVGGDKNDVVFFQGSNDSSVHITWKESLKTTPDIVSYNLKPLHTILPDGHPAQSGLKEEVEKYIKENAVLKKCSESCKIGHRSNSRDPCACVCNGNQNIRSNCCPAGKGLATLRVYNLYARGLYGDCCSQTDASVVVKYTNQEKRTERIDESDNPNWSESFDFGPIVVNNYDKLTFTVYDDDTYWKRDLLGSCSIDLRSGIVSNSCMFDHGTFFFSYSVECAPSLGGNQCEEYIPSPMDPSLAKVFYSRNGVLLGDLNKGFVKSAPQPGLGQL
ncbi:perforin-1-like [Gambusia affinis]|uniref:perforin-1-like n=1 Tax=Gambusia affinis TaxID=33528 RepID=UPI001CDCAAA0|nr:perforin-1-like [Gambusia affinis]XP_043970976.1 perforin-1-like [Gambusia affinis]XP_043970977.1 perforin-1-like [Gambusia affinis]